MRKIEIFGRDIDLLGSEIIEISDISKLINYCINVGMACSNVARRGRTVRRW